jgi:hypothetical protein
MRRFGLYRIAACLLLFFCAGHTAGGMLGQKSLGPAADAVFAAMKAVRFTFNGSQCTWYGFWLGLGLTCSVFLLFSAIAAWRLGGVAPAEWRPVSAIAWALFGAHVANAALTWRYFFVGAGALASLIALLLGVAAWQMGRRAKIDRTVN